MTLREWQDSIDPVRSNWKTTSPGHWTNTASGVRYDTTDLVQAQLDAYNASAGKPGGPPRFIPGITPVPKEIQVIPGGQPVDGGNKPGPNKPGPTTGGPLPPGSGGVTNPYIPGSTWNPTGPGGAGGGPGGAGPGIGGPMQWQENAGTGTGGPQRTGMAMPFTPWGEQQAMSTEILRYGGRPNSGAGGKWVGGGPAPGMVDLFTPRSNSGQTSAGALDPPYAQGGSDPAGQTLPSGSYDTSGTTKEQMAARAKALQTQMHAAALREYLARLEGGSTIDPIHTGTGTGGLGR